MNTDLRQKVIMWLENTRSSGEFVGFEEEHIDFDNMSDDDIQWYWDNWVQQDSEDIDG